MAYLSLRIKQFFTRAFTTKCLFFIIYLHVLPFSFSQNDLVTVDPVAEFRKKIIKEAEKHLGKKYKTQIHGQIMDCSGYTRLMMSKHGINITRSSVTQVHDGIRVKNLKDAKPGDVLVFKGRNARNNRPGHVGLVHHWSNDTLYFIHSSVQKGITIDHMFDPYYKKRFLQVRDVISGKKLN